jgi:RNA polymerase sigma factor (TIGR02999 family)
MLEGEATLLAPMANADGGGGAERMFAALYDDLHRVAVRELRSNSAATLSPSTLLQETYLNGSVRKLAGMSDRRRFMRYASRAMRGLIIDYLRRGQAKQRGDALEFVALPENLPNEAAYDIGIDPLRDALDALSALNPRLSECVDLKFFCGFSFAEIARLWNVSERTVQRDWSKARLLLNRLIAGLPVD